MSEPWTTEKLDSTHREFFERIEDRDVRVAELQAEGERPTAYYEHRFGDKGYAVRWVHEPLKRRTVV